MINGWLKAHRKITKHWVWNVKPFSEGQAWLDLLMNASPFETEMVIKDGVSISLKKGEQFRSNTLLSNEWGWSRGKVKRFIKKLLEDNMIEKRELLGNYKKISIITIVNFDKYQQKTSKNESNGQVNGHTVGRGLRSVEGNGGQVNGQVTSITVDKSCITCV